MGDRKKRYQAYKDIKKMFKQILRVRREREVEVALKCLNECSKALQTDESDTGAQNQIDDLTNVFEKLDVFYGKLLDEV